MKNKGLLCANGNIGFLMLACLGAIICTPISTALAQPRTSMCITTHSVNLLAPFVAQKKGIFKAEGLEVDIVQALSTVCLTGGGAASRCFRNRLITCRIILLPMSFGEQNTTGSKR